MAGQSQENKYVVVEVWYSFWGRRSFRAYFKTMKDVLPGYLWAKHVAIDNWMAALKTTDVDTCLAKLNDHWTPEQLQKLMELGPK